LYAAFLSLIEEKPKPKIRYLYDIRKILAVEIAGIFNAPDQRARLLARLRPDAG